MIPRSAWISRSVMCSGRELARTCRSMKSSAAAMPLTKPMKMPSPIQPGEWLANARRNATNETSAKPQVMLPLRTDCWADHNGANPAWRCPRCVREMRHAGKKRRLPARPSFGLLISFRHRTLHRGDQPVRTHVLREHLLHIGSGEREVMLRGDGGFVQRFAFHGVRQKIVSDRTETGFAKRNLSQQNALGLLQLGRTDRRLLHLLEILHNQPAGFGHLVGVAAEVHRVGATVLVQ